MAEAKTVKAADMSVEQLKALAYDERGQMDLHAQNLQAIEAELRGRATPTPAVKPNRAARRAGSSKAPGCT